MIEKQNNVVTLFSEKEKIIDEIEMFQKTKEKISETIVDLKKIKNRFTSPWNCEFCKRVNPGCNGCQVGRIIGIKRCHLQDQENLYKQALVLFGDMIDVIKVIKRNCVKEIVNLKEKLNQLDSGE